MLGNSIADVVHNYLISHSFTWREKHGIILGSKSRKPDADLPAGGVLILKTAKQIDNKENS